MSDIKTTELNDVSALGLISYRFAFISLNFIVVILLPNSGMIMAIIIVGIAGIGIASLIDFCNAKPSV